MRLEEATVSSQTDTATFVTTDGLLAHWEGHRRLTRRVLEAYPEDKLFSFQPAPPMRPFGALILEIDGMVAPTLNGLATGSWEAPDWAAMAAQAEPSKTELLERWDKTSKLLREHWSEISEDKFPETQTAFGQWQMTGSELIFYLIDNEIHHRGQGYVYLRLLGIEPPAFPER